MLCIFQYWYSENAGATSVATGKLLRGKRLALGKVMLFAVDKQLDPIKPSLEDCFGQPSNIQTVGLQYNRGAYRALRLRKKDTLASFDPNIPAINRGKPCEGLNVYQKTYNKVDGECSIKPSANI